MSPGWYHSIALCLPVHVWSSVKVTTCLSGHVKATWADSHMPRGSAPSSTVMSLHPVTTWWVSVHTRTTLTGHFSHSHGSNGMYSGTELKVSFRMAEYFSKGRSGFSWSTSTPRMDVLVEELFCGKIRQVRRSVRNCQLQAEMSCLILLLPLCPADGAMRVHASAGFRNYIVSMWHLKWD